MNVWYKNRLTFSPHYLVISAFTCHCNLWRSWHADGSYQGGTYGQRFYEHFTIRLICVFSQPIPDVVPLAIIISCAHLGKLSIPFWSTAVGIFHPGTWVLVILSTDVRWDLGCSQCSSSFQRLRSGFFAENVHAQGHCHARACLGFLITLKKNFKAAAYNLHSVCVYSFVATAWGRSICGQVSTDYWQYSVLLKKKKKKTIPKYKWVHGRQSLHCFSIIYSWPITICT